MPKLELQPHSKEPPLIASVRDYWKRKRNDRELPDRKAIKPTEIKEWLPYILLADVIDGGKDFRYRLVGSRLHTYFPMMPTGKTIREAIAPFGDETLQQTLEVYGRVVKQRSPLRIKGDGAWYNQPPKIFEAILTPLSDDGVTVNMIFGAFDFQWNFEGMTASDTLIEDQTMSAASEILR